MKPAGVIALAAFFVAEPARYAQTDDTAKAVVRIKAETVVKMRALLLMKTDEKYTVEYSNYRKFSTDVNIVERYLP
jgi:hypothetical protein